MVGSFRVKRRGGPQTAEGKAVAARNSLKTGMNATAVVLPHENPSDFEALNESLLVELDANGLLEASLVREIAVVTWKKIRLDGLEGRCLSEVLARPETPAEFYEAGFSKSEGVDWALANLVLLSPEYLEESRLRLDQPKLSQELLEKRRSLKIEKDEEKRLRDEYIERKAQELTKTGTRSMSIARMLAEEELGPEEVTDLSEEKLDIIRMVIDEERRSQDKGADFVGERLESVQRLKGIIRDKRLADFLGEDRFQRGHEDLNRALSRALRELRALQAWRKKHEVIDVTPNELNSRTD